MVISIKGLMSKIVILENNLRNIELKINLNRVAKKIEKKTAKIRSELGYLRSKIKEVNSLVMSDKRFKFIKLKIFRVRRKINKIKKEIVNLRNLTTPHSHKNNLYGEWVIGVSAIAFFIAMKFVFLKYLPWFINLTLLMVFIFWAYYFYLKLLVNSWREHPLKIMVGYVGVMLTVALLFYPLYLIGNNYAGAFYNCGNSSIKINPDFYFSVSNTFSLSYTEPVCTTNSLSKLLLGSQGIIGNVITVIILGIVIGAFINQLNNPKK